MKGETSVLKPRRVGQKRAWHEIPSTQREIEILQDLANGDTVAEIAAQRWVEPHTVHYAIWVSKKKLQAETTASVVATALRRGLIK